MISPGFISCHVYARNIPGSICQYKEDGLVSRPPSLFTSMRQPLHGTSCLKSQLKSTCLTAKFGSFLDHAETGEKGQNVINSSVQHPISLIFAIHVSLIIPLPMMWILLTKPTVLSVINAPPLINAPLTYFQIKLGKMPKFLYGVSL